MFVVVFKVVFTVLVGVLIAVFDAVMFVDLLFSFVNEHLEDVSWTTVNQ